MMFTVKPSLRHLMKKLSIHLSVLLLSLLLCACQNTDNTIARTPAPIPGHAQEVKRSQTRQLTPMWHISAQVYGGPLNTQAILQKQADAAGARYYYVVSVDETTVPGQWYAQAILYR